MENKLFPYIYIYIYDTWVASKYSINTIGFQLQSRRLMKESAYWKRHLSGALWGFPWPMTNGRDLGWRGIPISQYHRCHPTWSSIYLSLHLHHSTFLYKLDFTSQNIIHPKASNIFKVLLKFFLLSHLSVFVTKKDFFSHVWVGGYVTTRKESTSKDHMPSQKFKYRRKRLLVMAYGPRRPSYLHLSLKEILRPYLRK